MSTASEFRPRDDFGYGVHHSEHQDVCTFSLNLVRRPNLRLLCPVYLHTVGAPSGSYFIGQYVDMLFYKFAAFKHNPRRH